MVMVWRDGSEREREKLEYNWKWNTWIVVNIFIDSAVQYSTAYTQWKHHFMKKNLCIVQAHIWIEGTQSLSQNKIPLENWIYMQMTDNFFLSIIYRILLCWFNASIDLQCLLLLWFDLIIFIFIFFGNIQL